jgi:hypothetical protein
MIRQVPLSAELLEMMISVINIYKNRLGGLKNPLSSKNPLLDDTEDAFTSISTFLRYFDLDYLFEDNYVLTFKGKDDKERPYPSGITFISASGRFAGINTYDLCEYNSSMYGYFIFDMEKYDFVNFRWHDLEGIDETRGIIYGRPIHGDVGLQTDTPYKYFTNDDGAIVPELIEISETWFPSYRTMFFTNNNKLPLNSIFFLSEELNDQGEPTFESQLEKTKNDFSDSEDLVSLIDAIIKCYNKERSAISKNLPFYPMILMLSQLHNTMLKFESSRKDKLSEMDDDLPF